MRVLRFIMMVTLLNVNLYANANVELLNRVVAIVDDDIVLQTELDDRVEQFKSGLRSQRIEPPPLTVLEARALEQLVLESIQLQLAERMGIRVSDTQLNQTMTSIAERNRMTLDEFQQALTEEGLSYESARDKFRREMITTRLQQRMVDSRVRVTEKEVRDYLDSAASRESSGEEFRLAHILLATSAELSEATQIAKAEEIREQVRAGADFSELAARFSNSGTAMQGGDLGWRKADQLPSLFAAVVPELAPGDVSVPLVNSSGVHLVAMTEKRGGVTRLVKQVKARHILIQVTELRSDEQAEEFIYDLYRQLQAGESFSQLAKAYSNDTVSASNGGGMDWLNPGDTVPEFDQRIMSSEKNVLIPPFRTQYGWHVAEVTDTRETDIGQQIQENQARQVLHRRKYEEELLAWLSEIRAEAFVQLKL
jgi:peptidyl-prolyl cis-trans isomerase SurA